MPFIYDETIPAANNNPSADQPVMQANALAITQLIAVDHVTFNSADSGKHEQVTFNLNQSAPGLNGGVSVLFANLLSGQSIPYWQNALGTNQLAFLGANNIAANGYITLNGLIIQWGNSPSTPSLVNFPLAFPNACFVVVGSTNASDRAFAVTAFNQTQFAQSVTNPAGVTSRWIAIGN